MPFAKPKVKPKGSRTFTQTGYADRLHVYTNLVSGGVVEVFHGTREGLRGIDPALAGKL
ncbi:MAG: hypothetical protein RIT19_1762 [Verrucomicrobiota bacterium]